MPIESSFMDNERIKVQTRILGPALGIDTKSGIVVGESGTALSENYWESLQNMQLKLGVPTRMNGSTLFATGFVALDGDHYKFFAKHTPLAGTASWVVGQQDGVINRITVTGGVATTVQLFEGFSTSPTFWSTIQLGDYTIATNQTDGHWKYDGTDWLPLGAKKLAGMESDEDAQWAGETVETTIIRHGVQSYSTGSIAALGSQTLTFTPTVNLDAEGGLQSAKDYDKTIDSIGFFFRVDDASELDEVATSIKLQTSGGNDITVTADLWIDKGTNAAVVFTDNTWFHIEIPMSTFTETGTFLLADIDVIEFFVENDGAGALVAYMDLVYVIYAAAAQMPPARVNMKHKNVYWAGGTANSASTAEITASEVHFAKVLAPDEYDALAFFSVEDTDGTEVQALAQFFDQLFIGKDDSCHSLNVTLSGTVYPNYNLELIHVTQEHGVSSHRSQIIDGKLLYLYWRGQLWTYDGTSTEYVSNLIEPTLADVEPTRFQQVVSAHLNRLNEIWWTWPTAGSTDNDAYVRLSTETKGFIDSAGQTLMNLLVTSEDGTPTLLTVDDAGRVLEQDRGTDFDGSPIVAVCRPSWFTADDQLRVKCWLDCIVNFARFVGGGTTTVQVRFADHPAEFNSATFQTIGTYDSSLTTGESFGRVFVGEISKWVQIQVTTTSVPLTVFFPWIIFSSKMHEYY